MRVFLLTLLASLMICPQAHANSAGLLERAAMRRAARLQRVLPMPKIAVHRNTSSVSLLSRSAARRKLRLARLPAPLTTQVIEGINTERAKLGLMPLAYEARLERAAQAHALDMQRQDYFSHKNLQGERVDARAQRNGYGVIEEGSCNCSYRIAFGENIAKGQTTATQVVEDWMNSPPHRKEILEPEYKDIGVGIVDDIWVLNLGFVEIYGLE